MATPKRSEPVPVPAVDAPPAGGPAESVDLSINPLIAKISPQPNDQREFKTLVGYIAERKDGVVKVYPTLDLHTFCLIPESAIIWAEKLEPGQASSPTRLVVAASARIQWVTTFVRTSDASFLTGEIVDGNLSRAKPAAAAPLPRPLEANPNGHSCVSTGSGTCVSPPGAHTGCYRSGVCVSAALLYELP